MQQLSVDSCEPLEEYHLKNRLYLTGLMLLSACNFSVDTETNEPDHPSADATRLADTDPLHFADAKAGSTSFTETPVLRAQVILDRLGFSPGVIDGEKGQSYDAALRAFQKAKGLDESGALDQPTLAAMQAGREVAATRLVTIPAAFAKGPFFPDLPDGAAKQAELPELGYKNLMEALAERFHTTPETLIALNSRDTKIGAGKVIRVPNIADVSPLADQDDRGWSETLQKLGVASQQPTASKLVVDKSEGVLRAYDDKGDLIGQFPATMGSGHDPLPIGTWKIQGVSRNPDFHYNPKLFWDVSDDKEAQLLPPGPNGPVGVVWIDLSKPHYGIHGTNAPHTIGRAESHGCVRLTNWDAARLAQMVKPGVEAVFQE
ncbi:MAG: lipoprotein-anchoring transpeptidase ErfK/SrfK [Parasphingorhabdus sp.]|jgi:lipoprotein-anchoring transpeptidase ErfK/SrfK|tara:strand:- start:388 stop:1512 length:1125 start_codon:yes stop_codon:yes gene_type:complete